MSGYQEGVAPPGELVRTANRMSPVNMRGEMGYVYRGSGGGRERRWKRRIYWEVISTSRRIEGKSGVIVPE